MAFVSLALHGPVASITLDDPARRNALSVAMFDALDASLAAVAGHEASAVLRLRGNGPAFCAGFDLEACVADATLLPQFIRRLSAVNRALRRLRHVVVAEVQGAALAGGCALLSACDFVCVAPDAQLGYPVHRIGVSPAVSLPTLRQAVGGNARPLTLEGTIIDGRRALAIGLATHCEEDLPGAVGRLCDRLAEKGPAALAATKAWLNELDGSDGDDAFERTAEASASLCSDPDCRERLERFWAQRKR